MVRQHMVDSVLNDEASIHSSDPTRRGTSHRRNHPIAIAIANTMTNTNTKTKTKTSTVRSGGGHDVVVHEETPRSASQSRNHRRPESSVVISVVWQYLPWMLLLSLVLLANGLVSLRGVAILPDAFSVTDRVNTYMRSSSSSTSSISKDENETEGTDTLANTHRTKTGGTINTQGSAAAAGIHARTTGNSKTNKMWTPFVEFDAAFVHEYTLSDGVMVQVGRQGPAVKRAIHHGLAQRMKGFERHYWDRIENPTCLEAENDDDDDHRGGGRRRLPERSRSMMTNSGTITTTTTALASSVWQRQLDVVEATSEQRKAADRIRLPQAILIGVQKGGTTALYHYLDHHPMIRNCQKELYFLDEAIDEWMVKDDSNGIPQARARQRYAQVMTKACRLAQDSQHDTEEMILDLTPNYLMESDRLPQRIACVVPWVKLFVLLRNPMDRARSQYDMKLRFAEGKNTNVPTFDEYVANDVAALKETGVLQDWAKVDFELFWNSDAMWEAWRTYLNSGLNAPVGMGLYALQVQPFMKIVPKSSFLAIQSEDLQHTTDATYQRVLEFLGLPPHHLEVYKQANYASRKTSILNNATRLLLKETFAPFNRKLADLLGSDWEGVWT